MSGAGKRKVRCDKKRDVNPTVSSDLRDCIFRLSYITNNSVMSVAEAICINGIANKKVISHLSVNFRRPVRIDNVLYMGDMTRLPVKKRTAAGQSERVSIRFTSQTYEAINALSWALDCTVSRACALLLDSSVRDSDFINEFVRRYLEDSIDDQRMRELRKVLKYVNANNPYKEEYSWAALLSFMVDEVKSSAEKVQDTVSEFVVSHWKK